MVRKLAGLFAAMLVAAHPAADAQKPAPSHDRATVLLFVSTECPYSNRYAPEIRRIYQTFTGKGVRFWLVYPNRADTPAKIAQHLKDYEYPEIVLRTKNDAFVRAVKPTVTPEAAVFDASRKLVYQGRIDDRFVELMVERPSPTSHDLEQAISSVLEGQPVATAKTVAVGCFVADMR